MPIIAGFGGTLTFNGTATEAVRSFTLNHERASLDVTTITDFRERRIPGRFRRSGTLTLYRQDGTNDNDLRTWLIPTNVLTTVYPTTTLTIGYQDSGSITYATMNVQITSASFTDDGTGPAMWELSWEEQ
jgi:hypothetical protein